MTAPAGASPAELRDRIATLRVVIDDARRDAAEARQEAVEAQQRAVAAERAAAARVADVEDRVAAADAAVEDAVNQLADVLVVLARWGVNIDRGHVGALVEYALREAAQGPCRASCRESGWAA